MKKVNPIELEVFKSSFSAICDEMGVALCRSSFSPNIKERQDFSCAIFDSKGILVAQAAHIPVHLGSMPLSVQAAVEAFSLKRGDAVILNDPYFGGTHLPDITLVNPVFIGRDPHPAFFVANRAHHSDVGGQSPGSMPLADHLEKEGVVIPPTLFQKNGRLNEKWLNHFLEQVRDPEKRKADLMAQQSANHIGMERLLELIDQNGQKKTLAAMWAYQKYQENITRNAIARIPGGVYSFEDYLDNDGLRPEAIAIRVTVKIHGRRAVVDFTASAPQVNGPLNATYAITLSAVAYVFRCVVLTLTGQDCLSLQPITLKTHKGTVVDSRYPAPVAGGNVETSQRIVDVLLGALSQALPKLIPAASQGTMNNIAMGGAGFTYYETLAGGMGARPVKKGEDAIHTHMTNTLNTPIEALENELPIQITGYHIRRNSGGRGKFRGGNGLVRSYGFIQTTQVSLLTERRRFAPYGLAGGQPGKRGRNLLVQGKKTFKLPSKIELSVNRGDQLIIETPGGGGFGKK